MLIASIHEKTSKQLLHYRINHEIEQDLTRSSLSRVRIGEEGAYDMYMTFNLNERKKKHLQTKLPILITHFQIAIHEKSHM